ncbi:MAG: RNA polymerase sigma factor [Flavobacteriales bacterium]
MLFKKKAKPDNTLSDEEIVARLQQAMEADRFAVLYDRYSTKVFQKCLGMTRNRELAQDLTHDIFVKAFVNLSKFDHRAKFGTWLYSITYNYCLDHLRKDQRYRSEPIEEEVHEGQEEGEDRYEAELFAIRFDLLEDVLSRLDPADRAMLLMKYQEEHSVKEIMEMLGLGESAVKMRMLRARERALQVYHQLMPAEP